MTVDEWQAEGHRPGLVSLYVALVQLIGGVEVDLPSWLDLEGVTDELPMDRVAEWGPLIDARLKVVEMGLYHATTRATLAALLSVPDRRLRLLGIRLGSLARDP